MNKLIKNSGDLGSQPFAQQDTPIAGAGREYYSRTTSTEAAGGGSSVSSGGRHVGDPRYEFYGTMSQDMLNNFLDRAIIMQGWCTNEYPHPDRSDDRRMLINIGAKYISRMGGMWITHSFAAFETMLRNMKFEIDELHKIDPQIICEGTVMEWVSITPAGPGVNDHPIPDYVYQDIKGTPTPPGDKFFNIDKMIYPPGMVNGNAHWGGINPNNAPDIASDHGAMWVYYLATRQIDAGCEGMHMGQSTHFNRRNVSNSIYWFVLNKIREYARRKARRGLVLINSNLGYYDPGVWQDSENPHRFENIVDNPEKFAPQYRRQLLFDFHTNVVQFSKRAGVVDGVVIECIDYDKPNPYQPVTLEYNPYKHLPWRPDQARKEDLTLSYPFENAGGLHPLGWYCTHNCYYDEIDNGRGYNPDIFTDPLVGFIGCSATPLAWSKYGVYNWDDISYFATQGKEYRNMLLIYLYYKLKCLDPIGHIQMPGRRDITMPQNTYPFNYTNLITGERHLPFEGLSSYRANTSIYGQEETIKAIWNGTFKGPLGWAHHDFTWENTNGLDYCRDLAYVYIKPDKIHFIEVDRDRVPGHVQSSLVFAGSSRMYFISNDGGICGYIKVNDNANGGTWLTACPTYAAQVPAHMQARAFSDLVASPDGRTLLYIGVDYLLHGFEIIDDWTYRYFDIAASILGWAAFYDYFNPGVSGHLVFATNDSVYYMGGDSTQTRIFAAAKQAGAWQLVLGPSDAAHASGLPGQQYSSQMMPAGGLAYDAFTRRIYYRTRNGKLAWYQEHSPSNYEYTSCPGNTLLDAQQLSITGNLALHGNHIYFAARYAGGNTTHIHSLVENGAAGWATVSPSYSAQTHNHQPVTAQQQADPYGQVAVSPDGKTIAYFGLNQQYMGFLATTDGLIFTYSQVNLGTWFDPAITPAAWVYNSLLFRSSDDLYFITPYHAGRLRHLKYEEVYCNNNTVHYVDNYKKTWRRVLTDPRVVPGTITSGTDFSGSTG